MSLILGDNMKDGGGSLFPGNRASYELLSVLKNTVPGPRPNLLTLEMYDVMAYEERESYIDYYWEEIMGNNDYVAPLIVERRLLNSIIQRMDISQEEKFQLLSQRGLITNFRSLETTYRDLDIQELVSNLQVGDAVLEIGPGDASTLISLANLNPQTTFYGVDINPSLGNNVSNLSLIQANLDHGLPDATLVRKYKLIFSNRVIQYLSNPMDIIKQVYNILEDDGSAVLHLGWSPYIDQSILDYLQSYNLGAITIIRKEKEAGLGDGIYIHVHKKRNLDALRLPNIVAERDKDDKNHPLSYLWYHWSFDGSVPLKNIAA